MSLDTRGRLLHCDGENCKATTSVPVALRTAPSSSTDDASHTVDGWLYVIRQDRSLHFCPRCIPQFLRTLQSEKAPEERLGAK